MIDHLSVVENRDVSKTVRQAVIEKFKRHQQAEGRKHDS